MIKREQIAECMNAMEDGMINTSSYRYAWQNNLIWWICKANLLILEWIIKHEKQHRS